MQIFYQLCPFPLFSLLFLSPLLFSFPVLRIKPGVSFMLGKPSTGKLFTDVCVFHLVNYNT